MKRKGQSADAWFYSQSFHGNLDVPTVPMSANLAPACERCGQPDPDWPDFTLNAADICFSCTAAEGMQHYAPYVLRDRWHAAGGHCCCEDCAPPRALVEERDKERRTRTLATMNLWAERVFLGLWTHAEYARAVSAYLSEEGDDR